MGDINIKYLAEKLNMAPSTVSRALNDSYEISEATKVKVKALAKELNYQPNPYARSLRAHKSKTIAVIIPEMINNFFSQVIEGIEEITQGYDYHLLVYNTHEDVETERKIVSFLLNGRVDAIVMSVSSQTSEIDHLEMIHKNGLPIIFFDRICQDIPTTKFITNDFESGYNSTLHLLDQGCKRIYFLLLSKEISISKERMKGYQAALRERDITFNPNWVVQCFHKEEDNVQLLSNLLIGKNRPDGLLASVEKLAIASYHAIQKAGLLMPEDLKLISFSNMKIAGLLNPPLTTVSQPAFEIGSACAQLLMKKLTKKNQPDLDDRVIVLPSKIIVRKSTGG
jgi:LacI family transcriptional regulator